MGRWRTHGLAVAPCQQILLEQAHKEREDQAEQQGTVAKHVEAPAHILLRDRRRARRISGSVARLRRTVINEESHWAPSRLIIVSHSSHIVGWGRFVNIQEKMILENRYYDPVTSNRPPAPKDHYNNRSICSIHPVFTASGFGCIEIAASRIAVPTSWGRLFLRQDPQTS